jgi:hypothetical protein
VSVCGTVNNAITSKPFLGSLASHFLPCGTVACATPQSTQWLTFDEANFDNTLPVQEY